MNGTTNLEAESRLRQYHSHDKSEQWSDEISVVTVTFLSPYCGSSYPRSERTKGGRES